MDQQLPRNPYPSSAVSSESLYAVLGVGLLADRGMIRRAYLKAVLNCHPDRTQGDPAATQHFRRIQEAYEVLSDPDLRAEYDLLFLSLLSYEEYLRRYVDLTLTAQGLQLEAAPPLDRATAAR